MATTQEPTVISSLPDSRATARPSPQTAVLVGLVFVEGMTTMATEMSASRLLLPYFGSSLYIWAILIGLVFIYLSAGYYLGGWLADRQPRASLLYQMTVGAGLFLGLVPWLAQPILEGSLTAFKSESVGGFVGALLAVVALFAVPVVILGTVTTFAIRLALGNEQPSAGSQPAASGQQATIEKGGRIAGSIYALSTVGSIVGTFVPVFLLIPSFGARASLLLVAGLLATASLLALLAGRGGRRGPLLLVVFCSGISGMAIQMTASRFVEPYFGSSLTTWGVLIGLTLVFLSLGYYLGGNVADRAPQPRTLFSLTLACAGLFALATLLATPVLDFTIAAIPNSIAATFVAVIILFALPLTLVGMTSPFAIRLALGKVERGGRTAGRIYALSTLGSIIGTFGPVFLLIPTIGTFRTILAASLILLAFSIAGLLITQPGRGLFAVAAPLLLIALILFVPPSLVKPAPYGRLVAERESSYGYIQVLERDGQMLLALNEGHAIHSKYNPDPAQVLVGGPWDYFGIAPYFNPNHDPAAVQSLCMVGSAAGTVSKEITRIYGPIRVDNVEIDPEIVKIGQTYFAMNEPNVKINVADGRYFIRTSGLTYDIVGVDAYRQPYIPFQLTTREFFQEVRDRLTPGGVMVVNAGRYGADFRLVEAIANTMSAVYPSVWIVDVAGGGNSMVIGTNQPTRAADFAANAARLTAAAGTNPNLKTMFARALQQGNIRPPDSTAPARIGFPAPFTDDRAPLEQVVNQLILGAVATEGK